MMTPVNGFFFSEGRMKAIQEASKNDVALLQDSELPALFADTNFQNKLQNQRYNILILGYCLGWRPSTMMKMQPNMFKKEVLADGRVTYQVHAGSMKNLQQTVDKSEVSIFKQTIISAHDPRYNNF